MAAQAELVHLKDDEPLEHVLEVLDADGAVIVEECFSDEVINQILAELMPYAEKPDSNRTHISPTIAAFFGEHTRHVTGSGLQVAHLCDRGAVAPSDARHLPTRCWAPTAPTSR